MSSNASPSDNIPEFIVHFLNQLTVEGTSNAMRDVGLCYSKGTNTTYLLVSHNLFSLYSPPFDVCAGVPGGQKSVFPWSWSYRQL